MKITVRLRWKPASLATLGKIYLVGVCDLCLCTFFLSSQPTENAKFKEEEEMLRKRFTEQVKAEENRFRKWEQQVMDMEQKISRVEKEED